MSDIKPVNLRELSYSPLVNPLIEPQEVRVKKRYIRTNRRQDVTEPLTGEVVAVSAIHIVEERDDASFVKVFAEGVAAAYGLKKSAYRVFQAVLAVYENTPMRGGYAESIELFWFGDGLNGRSIDMSEKTFQRGLKELLALGFLAPKVASVFWVNPTLFFKGDRVAFIKEYRRRSREEQQQLPLE